MAIIVVLIQANLELYLVSCIVSHLDYQVDCLQSALEHVCLSTSWPGKSWSQVCNFFLGNWALVNCRNPTLCKLSQINCNEKTSYSEIPTYAMITSENVNFICELGINILNRTSGHSCMISWSYDYVKVFPLLTTFIFYLFLAKFKIVQLKASLV